MEKPRSQPASRPAPDAGKEPDPKPREIGGPPGPEPTRHGDWEFNGRCTDF
ncbi:MAG TPA: DUF1674 domain-containing protein [Stellaceae bacterium]|nr:DUF1674 domain-containing protein [Stellaceae bacterium]